MINEVIDLYNQTVRGQFTETYGGHLRSEKGALVENLAKKIVQTAWANLGGAPERLSFEQPKGPKKVRIPIREDAIHTLPPPAIEKIKKGDLFYYDLMVDVHVFIDNKFVLGIECKSYTENAMLKRILIDFYLLKTKHPELNCCLLQLETQLGGVNDVPGNANVGNRTTYTLMSYFPNIDLEIITLLEGQREVDKPIHKKEHFKEMKPEFVRAAIEQIERIMRLYLP